MKSYSNTKSQNVSCEMCYSNLFRRKAIPDDVFRYFSNAAAFVLFGNPQNQTNAQGLNFNVCLLAPSLCFASLAFKSAAMPV
jgi:hypothetical protein